MARRITYDMLYDNDACLEQRELFQELFPNGVEVTKALCVTHVQDFDWGWAGDNLLYGKPLFKFRDVGREAYRVYRDVWSPALEAYDAAKQAGHKKYRDIDDATRAEYDRILESVRAKENEVINEAHAKCAGICKSAWDARLPENEYRQIVNDAYAEFAKIEKDAKAKSRIVIDDAYRKRKKADSDAYDEHIIRTGTKEYEHYENVRSAVHLVYMTTLAQTFAECFNELEN